MLPPSSQQPDQQFSGFLSGHQTTMLLNSKRLYIKVELPSRQIIYESLIQYNPSDPIYVEVKKVFNNLELLYKYIEEYSQDIDRIKVSLKDLKIKIVKNQGPRRLKSSPVLYIPLKKIVVYEKKQLTKLHKDVETAISYNQILRCKFQYEKSERQRIMNHYNRLKDQIYHLINSYGLKETLLQQNLWDESVISHLEEIRENTQKMKRNSLENGLDDKELDQILLENGDKSEIDIQESLFFEDESVKDPIPRSLHSVRYSQKSRKSSIKEQYQDISHLFEEQKSFKSDPFSYLY